MKSFVLLCASSWFGSVGTLRCDHPFVDLGEVRGGPVLTHRFVLTNHSSSEVRIVHAQPSCGCVVPRLAGRAIRAGESVEITVSIATISQPEGANLWTVRLYYRLAGRDEDQVLELQIRAYLRREVALHPAAVRLSGKPGLTHAVQLIDRRPQPMDLRWVSSSSPRLEVWDEGTWRRVGGQWVRTVQLRMSADCPAGRHEDFVQIMAKDPDYQDVRLPVTLNRTDSQPIVVTPTAVQLSPELGEFAVILRHTEGQPLQVEEAECDDPAVDVRFGRDLQQAVTLKFRTRPGIDAQHWSSVRVLLTKPTRHTVVIPVTVKGANSLIRTSSGTKSP